MSSLHDPVTDICKVISFGICCGLFWATLYTLYILFHKYLRNQTWIQNSHIQDQELVIQGCQDQDIFTGGNSPMHNQRYLVRKSQKVVGNRKSPYATCPCIIYTYMIYM